MRERGLVGAREGQAGRGHQRLLRPRHDNVHAPLVLRQRHGADRRHRVHGDQRVVAVGDLRQLLEVVDHAGRGLRERREHDRHVLVLGEPAVQLGGVDLAAPLGRPVDGLGAVGVAQLGPALAEVAAAGDQHGLPGTREVGDCRLHRTGARGGEHLHLVGGAEDQLEPLQDAGVDLHERGRPVIEHRLGHHLRYRGRKRGRARRHQVLLQIGICHQKSWSIQSIIDRSSLPSRSIW